MLQRRFDRERQARKMAETLLTEKSRELYEALTLVRESERQLQTALWASGEGIWEWSADTRQLQVRGLLVAGAPYEWPANDTQKLLSMVHVEDRDATSLAWRLHLSGTREDIDVAYRLRTPRGYRWLRIRGRALERSASGMASRLAGTIKDITNQRQSELSLNLMAHAFASTHDALAVIDSSGWIVEINQSFERLTNHEGELVIGTPLSDYLLLPPEATESVGWRGEVGLLTSDGRTPVEVTVTTVNELAGQGRCYIVAMHDISERKKAASELARMALTDALTGLPNRIALEQDLLERVRAGQPFGMLFLDLDGFKGINDSFGHGEGDYLLREMARRLREGLAEAVVARWGGDEFVVVVPGCPDDNSLRAIARRVTRVHAEPINTTAERELLVSPSIGAVLFPRDGADPAELFRKADAAMYLAKSKGRNRLQIFEPEIEESLQRRTQLETQLRVAAERAGFNFYAQPKVDREERQSGAELLVRWMTIDFGAVSPAEFIPLAEQTGVIDLLGRQALHVAAELGNTLKEIGKPLPLAVNLSPRQLQNPSFCRGAIQACQAFGVDPSMIELELTESALAAGIDQVRPLLQTLRSHGFGLALDDFGTGYSSLSHLRDLPFQKVKIDRSFVMDVLESRRARVMVESIIGLCKGLGLSTVAEGIETRAQFEALRAMGIDEFQGYFFARPMPIEQWLESLRVPAP